MTSSTSPPSNNKRKRESSLQDQQLQQQQQSPPKPLGVLEFTSALNGEDPLLILKKLHQFVRVVGFQRRLALSPAPPRGDKDGADDAVVGSHAVNDGNDYNGEDGNDSDSSLFSFDEIDKVLNDKRQKLTITTSHSSSKESTTTPEWQTDKKNYLVPFVGTSVAKGPTGNPVAPHSQRWPNGFLECYLQSSPLGVELMRNEYVSVLPLSGGGVYKSLLGGGGGGMMEFDGKNKKKKHSGDNSTVETTMMLSGTSGGQSRGQIISMTLQTNYWMAISEWISGFIPKETLQREISWEMMMMTMTNETSMGNEMENVSSGINNNKCAIPPQIMTILMKQRLPEWINAIHNYARMQHQYHLQQQREKQNQKKLQQKNQQKQGGKKGQHQQQKNQQQEQQQPTQVEQHQQTLKKQILFQKWQQRQEKLLMSALRNLIYLCYLSNGTAREVVRRLAMNNGSVGGSGAGAGAGAGGTTGGKGGKFGSEKGGSGAGGSGSGDGQSWMVQVFQPLHSKNQKQQQQQQHLSTRISSHNMQTECLQLACTLLETRDFVILSRIAEVPTWLIKRYGGGKDGKGGGGGGGGQAVNTSSGGGNFGIIYIVLRYGIQRLMELGENNGGPNKDEEEDREDIDNEKGCFIEQKEQNDLLYARYMTRLLRGVRNVLLRSATGKKDDGAEGSTGSKNNNVGPREGFVIGATATAELLSGEVLSNITQLSQLAPPFDATSESISAIIKGSDTYDNNKLSQLEIAAVEARRLLFLCLADGHCSPFLQESHHFPRGVHSAKNVEQNMMYMPQLAKALYVLMMDQGYSLPMRTFLKMCLITTPGMVPHFFKGLELNDPKPNYQSLAALSFIESVVREAPPPQTVLITTHATLADTEILPPSNSVLPALVPLCLTKTLLGKVVQSPSVLLISSGLKLITTLLHRACDCISSLKESREITDSINSNTEEFKDLHKSICQAMMRHLPEASLLLSIPSRFDPFESLKGKSPSRANALVVLELCETLQCYAKLDPALVSYVKFDWAKLLPNESPMPSQSSVASDAQITTRVFQNAEPLLQYRILHTLLVISLSDNVSFSAKMLPSLLSILVSSNIPEVYTAARELALSLMEKEIFPPISSNSSAYSIEVLSCHKYESSLWVDGISPCTIQELGSLSDESKQLRVQHNIMISQAWAEASLGYGMPPLGISSLLSLAICQIIGRCESQSIFSEKFAVLLIQIATKMLLFQTDPKPFAAMIVYAAQEKPPNDEQATGLHQLAKAILNDDKKANNYLELLSPKIFFSESSLNSVHMLLDDADFIALRQCLSLMKCPGNRYDELNTLLRKIFISVLETGDNIPDIVSRLGAALQAQVLNHVDRDCIVFFFLSFLGSRQFKSRWPSLSITLHSFYEGSDDKSVASSHSLGNRVVSTLLQCNMVPLGHQNESLGIIWKHCFRCMRSSVTQKPQLKDFLLKILLHAMPNTKETNFPFSLEEVFDLWALLARDLSTNLSVEFCLRLEDHLAASFVSMKDGYGTWNVYNRICSLTPDTFTTLCLHTLNERTKFDHRIQPGSNSGICYESNFLSALLVYDCSIFSCLASVFPRVESDANLMELWADGYLDFTAATFILQIHSQKSANIIATSTYEKMANMIGQRFLSSFGHKGKHRNHEVTFDLILDVLHALCSNQILVLETSATLLKFFDELEVSPKPTPIESEIRMMELAICVVSSMEMQNLNTSVLLSHSFLRCCKVLPKWLKKTMRTKHDDLEHSSKKLMNSFSCQLEKVQSFDESLLVSSVVDNCIVVCLKYGMMNSNDFVSCAIFGGCLKIIRLMLAQSYCKNSTSNVVLGKITPGQVHAMIISHSSFQTAIADKGHSSEEQGGDFCKGLSQQMEVARLMLCCVSLDSEHVKINSEVLTTLLSVYNASTDSVDRLLRRLIFLYDKNNSCDKQLMMDEFRWGSMSTKYNSQCGMDQHDDAVKVHGQSCEWFVEYLDIDRIKTTSSQFPVSDTLEPMPVNDIEYRDINNHKCDEQDDQKELLIDHDDESDDSIDDSVSESHSVQRDRMRLGNFSTEKSLRDEWRGSGQDLRYSPGFILPLILGTLETFLPTTLSHTRSDHQSGDKMKTTENSNEDDTMKDEEDTAQCQAFGQICRRLCGKGAISLAIASLSSRCPAMRKVAVAICGIFLESLQMEEAHTFKLWRERPQLEMLMSSLQRGLAVRRSMQIKNSQETQTGIVLGEDKPMTNKFNVPMLPAVSAVFLAKVLIILSNPGEDMYGPMNRYLLRLSDYHGAFQDCYGLPAFLSLYCSSSDDLSRCKTERFWALVSLKDSAVDDFCYRIIAKHHVPELIMSSFDSLIDHSEGKSEMSLTIETMISLIQSGGSHASTHMVKRLGLLSWLHGVISWRKISSIFPYVELKLKFLRLITVAVESYSNSYDALCTNNDDSTPAFFEGVPLADAVIQIFLDECADAPGRTQSSSNVNQSALIVPTCHALWAIHLARQSETQSNYGLYYFGITTLTNMASILRKFVLQEEMFSKVLLSMCALPFITNSDDIPSARWFCEMALGFVLEKRSQLSSDVFSLSLKRIHDLIQIYPILGEDPYISSQVMKCRGLVAALSNDDVCVWNDLVPLIKNVA